MPANLTGIPWNQTPGNPFWNLFTHLSIALQVAIHTAYFLCLLDAHDLLLQKDEKFSLVPFNPHFFREITPHLKIALLTEEE
jgi:hypothetical protein